MRLAARILTSLTALTATTAVAACGSDLTTPSDANPRGATGTAVAAVDSSLGTGNATRIEIELFSGELVAREVQVENEDDEEKIVSRVTAIDPAAGGVTLELGGLVLSYGAGTRFRTETESHQSRSTWEAAVQASLDAGGHPLIEARRNRSGSPQAPDDGTFVAADLRLDNDSDDPKIEIYVDDDNLESVSGTSSAVLRVLGLSIEVNGRTQLREDNDHPVSVEFRMSVAAVDRAAGTLTLTSGTVVRVTAATVISAAGDLFTLESTAGAVADGRPVRAEGRGTVESSGPPTVIASTSLKVEVDD